MIDITKKIDHSIKIIKGWAKWHNLYLAHSGGKDSCVIEHLCKIAGVPVTMVHNCTTIDPPYTLSFVKAKGCRVQRADATFFQLVEKKGLPSMFRRWCCSYFKEKYIADFVVLGVRASESNARSKRYTEPSKCRIYSKKVQTEMILPIYNWNIEDVQYFIEDNDIKLHPLYMGENGRYDYTKRLGCIGCPLQGDRGVDGYLRYPKFLRCLCHSYEKYVNTHKAVDGVYEDIIWQLFYSNHGDEKYQQNFHGLFSPPNAKSMLEDYFHILI